MSILDALTGDAYTRANKGNQYAISTGLQQGGGALATQYGEGLRYLLDGSNPSALTSLAGGYNQARGDLANQYGQTQGYLGQATGAYQPLVNAGQGSLGAYYDAIGANGAEGSQRATQAFQAAPGYQYQMDQALGAVQRSAAARGGLAGGNATTDILKTATGLADQSYQQYVQNLQGGVGQYASGVQGMAGGLTNQGQASASYGTALGNLGTGLGQANANIYGTGAQLQGNLGNAYAGMIGNATNQYTNSNNFAAQGQTQASGNALGALMGGATSLLGQAGQAGGISKLFGKIFA